MNLDYRKPYFNMTVAACRVAGSRGGRRSAGNRLFRRNNLAPVAQKAEWQLETTAEAIARIDTLFPWLRGAEVRSARRPISTWNN